jgi:CheY-like chemotaxis protein
MLPIGVVEQTADETTPYRDQRYMTTLAATAKIMVATDITGDAARVKGILSAEFKHVVTSTDTDQAASDFMHHKPDVLVLAFNKLEKSERYYLGLLQLCPKTHRHPYRTVILCYKEELKRAAELCLQVGFDDHILFWPMTFDDPNLIVSVHNALIMAVHNALRELAPPQSTGRVAFKRTALLQRMGRSKRHPLLQKMPGGKLVGTASRTAPQAEHSGPTILVVDDDAFQHKLIGKLLEAKDFHLVFASSGIEALNLMRTMKPDLILMDVMMPVMDGLDTMRYFRAMPQLAKVPVIMITGKSEGQVVSDSLKAGAVDFVVKPLDKEVLLSKLARFLTV